MLSGDNRVARGVAGPFDETLARFRHHWARIDIIVPYAADATETQLFDNVFVHPSPMHRWMQPLFIARKTAALLRHRPIHLVISHDYGVFANGWGALWLARRYHLPILSEIHHVEGMPVASGWRERLMRLMARLYLPIAARTVQAFRVVNSQQTPAQLQAMGVPAAMIRVLPSLYIDHSIFRPLPDVAKQYDLLFVGRLVENKGLFVLVDALHRLWSHRHDVTLAIRGGGPLRHALHASLEQLGLQDQVIWLDRVDSAEALATLYNQARMLVCASTVEGGPRVTVEAMACGVPVISTPVGIMPELLADGANGFIVHDAAGIARAVRRLLEDDTLAQQIGASGRIASQRYDADSLIAKYVGACHDIIEAYASRLQRPHPRPK